MEEEFLEYHSNNLWRSLYTKICIESRNNEYTAVEALKPENKQLNRYRDVYPYDHSRVPLSHVSTTDYINASLIEVNQVDRKYILTQGPLAGTTPHFWSLVWEQKTRAVIMLNRVMEKGTLKCHQYWPTSKGEVVTCDEVGLIVSNIEMTPGQHYNISTLRIENTAVNETRDVLHFHYTTWPDFGVPTCPDTFLEFLGAVRESGSLDTSKVGPPVIHCSAGIGRSGTFILVDSCLLEAENSGPEVVCIKQRLLDMRTYRMGLIQTEDQLKFSYQSIIEGARQLGLINSVPTFETPITEASDSSSEDDVPPPLPPPRTESLKKDVSQDGEEKDIKKEIVQLYDREVIIKDSEPFTSSEQFNNIPVKLVAKLNGATNLEEECGSHGSETTSSNTSSTEHSPNKLPILSYSKMEERKRELRRRKNEEEKSSTETKIKEVQKAIQKAEKFNQSSEEWKKRWEYWQEMMIPFCVGLSMFLVGGYLYFRDEVQD